MRRRPWFLLTGLLLGLGLGLVCSWVLCPARYAQTSPETLRADFKETYRSLIARAYAYDHNLPRARARLELLGERAPAEALAAQAQRALAAGHSPTEVSALGDLAAALGAAPGSGAKPTVAPSTPPSLTPLATASPTPAHLPTPTVLAVASPPIAPTLPPTPTPLPTRTPQPISTAGAPLVLKSMKMYCNPEDGPLLQIFVRDATDQPLPGVEIDIHWLGGDERIFTGLKPEIDPGYADFRMALDEVYQVRPAYGTTVTDLRARECETEEGDRFWGGWTLVFAQP